MSKQLYKSSAVVGGMTMVSRVAGFVRDMILANIFGVDAATDAFFVAFKIPNFLRRLFAEGAFAHAFVPVVMGYIRAGDRAALRAFIDKTAGASALLLGGLTLICMAGAPLLIIVFAPGFYWGGGNFEQAVYLLRVTMPYLFFIFFTGLAGGILNAHGKFAVPAVTPVFLNIFMIAAALWLAPNLAEPIHALAWAVTAAGAAQWLFQLPALRSLGLLPRLRRGWRDPAVRRLLGMMGPAIFGVSVVQINLLAGTLFASFLPAGSVSWLYYSDRLVEFPLGIFGVAVSTVILPSLAKSHAAEDAAGFSKSLDWALKLVLLIGLPATAGLTLLSEPLLSTFFQYNEFGADDVRMTARSLTAFSLGLLGFILIRVLVPGFTARQDTRTPALFGWYSMLGNLGLNALFILPLAHAGPALATTLAAYFNAGLLLRALLRRGIYRPAAGWPFFIGRVAVAVAGMAGFLVYAVDAEAWLHWHAVERGWRLSVVIVAAMAVYAVALPLLGVRIKDFWESHAG